jgi:hypothetical protein
MKERQGSKGGGGVWPVGLRQGCRPRVQQELALYSFNDLPKDDKLFLPPKFLNVICNQWRFFVFCYSWLFIKAGLCIFSALTIQPPAKQTLHTSTRTERPPNKQSAVKFYSCLLMWHFDVLLLQHFDPADRNVAWCSVDRRIIKEPYFWAFSSKHNILTTFAD